MKNNLVAKTSLNVDSLMDLLWRDFEKFEIHLDDTYRKPITFIEFEKLTREFNKLCPDIIAIHAPVTYECNKDRHVDLNMLVNDNSMLAGIMNAFMMAGYYAAKYGHKVGVIVNMSVPVDITIDKGELGFIYSTLTSLFKQYSDVDLYIENSTPIGSDSITFRNAHLLEPVQMANTLNDMIGEERVFTVLNTCHMKISIGTYLALNLKAPLSVNDYFKEYSSTCKLIHFSNAIGVAAKNGHCGFDDSEDDTLKQFISLIEDYMSNVDVVLEVKEDDYNIHTEAEKLKGVLEKYYNKEN